jgi:hypothetical protein
MATRQQKPKPKRHPRRQKPRSTLRARSANGPPTFGGLKRGEGTPEQREEFARAIREAMSRVDWETVRTMGDWLDGVQAEVLKEKLDLGDLRELARIRVTAMEAGKRESVERIQEKGNRESRALRKALRRLLQHVAVTRADLRSLYPDEAAAKLFQDGTWQQAQEGFLNRARFGGRSPVLNAGNALRVMTDCLRPVCKKRGRGRPSAKSRSEPEKYMRKR